MKANLHLVTMHGRPRKRKKKHLLFSVLKNRREDFWNMHFKKLTLDFIYLFLNWSSKI